MRLSWAVLLVAACGPVEPGKVTKLETELGLAVACGDVVCAPFEYCHVQCTCCGMPVGPDSGLVPSASFECRPIPFGCSGAALCSCPSVSRYGGCDAPKRLVEEPCG